jgi:hypothetical protein
LIKASEAVRAAKRVLIEAERRFDFDCGPDNSSPLIAEIMVAERRLAEATAQLREVARSHY